MVRTPTGKQPRRSTMTQSQMSLSPIQMNRKSPSPSPNSSKCPHCTKPVDDVGVQCDLCDSWFHHKCLNPKLVDKFLMFLDNNFILLQCRPCQTQSRLANMKAVSESGSVHPPLSDCGIQTELPTNVSVTTSTNDLPVPLNPTAVPFVTKKSPPVITLDDSPLPIIVHGHADPLSNMYGFTFKFFHPSPFKSVEHGYHYYRAVDQSNFKLAELIRSAPNSFEAKKLSKQLGSSSNREVDVELMEELLLAKSEQCASFRRALRNSGSSPLIHSTYPSDTFWASGLHFRDRNSRFPGKNMFGVLLTKVRSVLRPEPEYSPPRIECTRVRIGRGQSAEDVMVILHDGEKLQPPVAGHSIPGPEVRRPQSYASVVESGVQRTRAMDSVNRTHRCFHCWVPGHTHAACKHQGKTVRCYGCNTVGHKRKFCSLFWQSKSQPPAPQPIRSLFSPFLNFSQSSTRPQVAQPVNTPFCQFSQPSHSLNPASCGPHFYTPAVPISRTPLLGQPIINYAPNF